MAIAHNLSIGGITLEYPPTKDGYQVSNPIVAGREATALSGAPLSLNVIRKKRWRLTFHPGTQYAALAALIDTQVTFVDYDGTNYTVLVTDDTPANAYPIEDHGMMTITLREV
jgi:hypothetical protein